MAWKDISTSTFKHTFNCEYDTAARGAVFVTLQYDDSAISPTEAKIRFKLNKDNSKVSGDLFDTFYLLLNPDSSDRKLYGLKTVYTGSNPNRNAWPYYSDSLTLTKTYSTSYFKIPKFWLCNNANKTVNTTAQDFYEGYSDSAWRGRNLRTTSAAKDISIASDTTVAGAIKAGSVSITDKFNNSFVITATKGASGTNNTSGGPTNLKWGYDTNYSSSYTSGATNKLTVSGTGKTRRVYAKATTTAEYGEDKVAYAKDGNGTAGIDIRQYVGPNKPTGLKVTYNKDRLTVKENWTLSWTAPSINNECPIKGYRIRLYRKRGNEAWIKLPIYDTSGNMGHLTTITNVTPNDVYWDRDGTSVTATVYTIHYNKEITPAYPDILPGDIIKFSVTAYTRYGANYDGDKLFKTDEAFSSEYAVQNAGVLRVKQSGTWKEGQVFVKVSGVWKEADIVSVKVNGKWEESE